MTDDLTWWQMHRAVPDSIGSRVRDRVRQLSSEWAPMGEPVDLAMWSEIAHIVPNDAPEDRE